MSDGKAFTPFEPSANQLAVLSIFQAHGYGCKVADACEEAGISARAYYYWHDDPAFSAWWADQSNRFFSLQIGRVQSAVLASATTADAPGNPQAQKLFFERNDRDYCPASRNKTEISGGLDIDVLHMTPDELERYANATDDATPAPAGPVVPDAQDAADSASGQVATGTE